MIVGDTAPPLVVHVIHALRVGGLENGLVNLINRMPRERYRHAVVCMTDASDFQNRIQYSDVEVVELRREHAPLWKTYTRLFAYFVRRKPAIVHSRNLSGLDALIPAVLAGTRLRIHGEHGRDADDLDGRNPKKLRLRRMFRPLVSHYTAVSDDLAAYIQNVVGAPPTKVTQIYNGVDTDRFRPAWMETRSHRGNFGEGKMVIGTVGRLQPVKDQTGLIEAFAEARRLDSRAMEAAHLVVIGDGPCRPALEAHIVRVGLGSCVSILGERDDIPGLMRGMDLFVLPSLAEGISNTVLEAMATGLPVVATRVGGNPELVVENETGRLVAARDAASLGVHLLEYVKDAGLRARHGRAARARAEKEFSLNTMVDRYTSLYDRLLERLPVPDSSVRSGIKVKTLRRMP